MQVLDWYVIGVMQGTHIFLKLVEDGHNVAEGFRVLRYDQSLPSSEHDFLKAFLEINKLMFLTRKKLLDTMADRWKSLITKNCSTIVVIGTLVLDNILGMNTITAGTQFQ